MLFSNNDLAFNYFPTVEQTSVSLATAERLYFPRVEWIPPVLILRLHVSSIRAALNIHDIIKLEVSIWYKPFFQHFIVILIIIL